MPAIHGYLTGLINDENLEKTIAIAIPRDKLFDIDAPLPDKPANPHNLALDPLSIAFARLMGFSWTALASLAGTDDEGITMEFDGRDGGEDVLNLPKDHPCIEGRSFYDTPGSKIVDDAPRLIEAGNQSAVLILSGRAMWETVRDWPSKGGAYTDKGILRFNHALPDSVIAGMKTQAQARKLRLSDVLIMPGLDIDPFICDVLGEEWTQFRIHFPSGGGDYSVLPQEEA